MSLKNLFLLHSTVLFTPQAHGSSGYLYSSTIGHGLVGIDTLVQLLPIEEILQQLLDLGDSEIERKRHLNADTVQGEEKRRNEKINFTTTED
jgi:hypothetical protein